MKLVRAKSLAQTLDLVDEARFAERRLTRVQRGEAANWIARRQGIKGSHADLPAPTTRDLTQDVRTFTGERVESEPRIRHVLGEEACRALLTLHIDSQTIRQALEGAAMGLRRSVLQRDAETGEPIGTSCCPLCTVAMWRHLAASTLGERYDHLRAGLSHLRDQRDGKGRWDRYPF